MTTILLVEDSQELAAFVVRSLSDAGYRVIRAADGHAALARAAAETPDLIVLDWMLPGLDGLDVLRELRQRSAVPILMLTARVEEADRVIGLELGADDYLTKPFGIRELIARVRALLRRHDQLRRSLAADRADGDRPVVLGPLLLDPARHIATLDDQTLDLTPTEFALLHLLVRYPGRAFSRSYLVEQAWPDGALGGDRAVDNAVLRLRKKLGAHGEAIETVWGIGYRYHRE